MSTILKLPRVGMNMEEGTIVEWFVKPGEKFLEGDKLYACLLYTSDAADE